MRRILTIFLFLTCILSADTVAERAKALKLYKNGNYKESLATSRALIDSVQDQKSGQDLTNIISCLRRVNQSSSIDSVVEEVVTIQKDNFYIYSAAAQYYRQAQHYGSIIDEEYLRGQYSGRRVNSEERDRIRSFQLFEQGLAFLSKEDNGIPADHASHFCNLFIYTLQNQGSFRLQSLTDLTDLPDYEEQHYYHNSSHGAPTTPEGTPIFYSTPSSYATAKSDGERYRAILALMSSYGESYDTSAQKLYAQFLQRQFGVQTLQSYFRFSYSPSNENKSAILTLHTLSDEETSAKLATGVKRFTLPDEHNHIKIYQNLFKAKRSNGQYLASCYLDRMQFKKAADVLRESLQRSEDQHLRTMLDSIVKDWVSINDVSTTFPAGTEPAISIKYRNAQKATLSVQEVDLGKRYSDVIDWVQSNPEQLDWARLNFLRFDHHQKEIDKFLGKVVSTQTLELSPRTGYWDTPMDITIPVKKSGVYKVTIALENGKKVHSFVRLDDLTIVTERTRDGTLYSVVDAITGAPVADAQLNFTGYKQDHLSNRKGNRRYNISTHRFSGKTDKRGQYIQKDNMQFRERYSYAIEAKKGKKRAYLDFGNRRYHHSQVQEYNHTHTFGITDRPVYRPGQKVYGKLWVREAQYDKPDTSTYANQEFYISISNPKGETVMQAQAVRSDEYGGVEYSYTLPDDATLGRYNVSLGSAPYGHHQFRVEEYKKPEYEVTVESPSDPVKLGETFQATVKATYYHGAPVTNAKVKVKVMRHEHHQRWYPVGRWDWLYGPGYGWFDFHRPFYPGFLHWHCKGPAPFWFHRSYQQPELVMEQEYEINEDGTVKVSIDTAIAKEIFGDQNQRYEITAEVVDASRRTIYGSGKTLVSAKPFQVTAWLDRGHARVGDRIHSYISANTLDNKPVEAKGKMVVYHVTVDDKGEVKEEEVATLIVETDKQGKVSRFLQADWAGEFRIATTLTDKNGNTVTGATFITVRGEEKRDEKFAYSDLEITLDKKTYAPGETAQVLIKTKRPNSHVTLFLRGAQTYQLVKIEGQSAVVKMPITIKDMPNTFIHAFTVSGAQVHTVTTEVIVPPAKRVLNVEVVADKEQYNPRETGTLKVKITDHQGEPIVGAVALSVYDKSLEYISGGSNVADIKKSYWSWRRHFYLGISHSATHYSRAIFPDSVHTMYSLGAFGGYAADVPKDGGKSRAKNLELGLEKIVGRTLNKARQASAVSSLGFADADELKEGGAKLDDVSGNMGTPNAPVTVRNNFADLVKWQGHVETDDEGMATIPVEFPDNLTTWKVKTWAMTHGTRVGEGETELITSKDLIIRLQAPRFFVEKDEVTLSAVVHNYHDEATQAKVSLELIGGTLESSTALTQEVQLGAKNGEERVDWTTKVLREGEATIRMTLITPTDSDAMELTFPVYVHGILKQFAWSSSILPGQESTKVTFTVPEQRKPEQSRLEVRYSPTIAGSIISALPYLAEYPHGCTEQTLNRFVPTVISQKLLKDLQIDLEEVRNQQANLNPQEIGDDKERMAQWRQWNRNPVFSEKEVAKMTKAGVDRLVQMQNRDGGWGWFSGYGERSYPHTTAVVVHGLIQAQKNGAAVPQGMIDRGLSWIASYEKAEYQKLLNAPSKKSPYKHHSSNQDAMNRYVLAQSGRKHTKMQDFIFRDKTQLSVYGKSLLGLALHLDKKAKQRDEVISNIEEYLVFDDENQTAYLNLRNSGYWWYWYGSEFEAQAWYLKLLAQTNPESKQARGLVKYLVNNRKNATYWNSTRDTAYCIEAIAEYLQASGEFDPTATVEVLLDGKLYKTVEITKENLFSYDNKFTVAGDALTTGDHTVEIRRKGKGPLYTNTYFTLFTKEDHIKKTGLEVKVERRYYKVTQKDTTTEVSGKHGQVVDQKVDQQNRTLLKDGDTLKSGDLIEVELIIESKNDYEYLYFADWKPAGCENVDVRSGYTNNGLGAYMEVRDEKTSLYVRSLPRGKHNLTFQLKAEIPGKFSALPTQVEAMYAPELRANSDEMKLQIVD